MPNIENSWNNMCNFEQERAYQDALNKFKYELKDIANNGKANGKEFIKDKREEAVRIMKTKFIGDGVKIEEYESRIRKECKKFGE